MKIESVETLAQFEALEAEWRSLELRALPVPFVCFDWNMAWWKHLRSQRKSVSDSLHVVTFRTTAGALCGIAPLMMTNRPARGPFRFAQLQFFGADQNITEIRTLVATPDNMAVYILELSRYLKSRVGWDWTKLTGVPAATVSRQSLHGEYPQLRWTRELLNFYLVLKPTWEEFRSGLSRNIKESLRKCYNSPKRDGLQFDFHVLSALGDVKPALQEFLRLHSMRSQLTDTVAHPNVFAEPNAQSFLIDVCERFASRNALRIFQLRSGEQVIATRIGFVCGDSVYFYYSGYDTQFSKYSVMTTTVAEAIKYCIESGFKTINLSTGRDVSKERWGPAETLYLEAEFVAPRAAPKLKYPLYRFADETLRNLIIRTPLRGLLARRAT
ncbi:MAG: GNAT family N-acetyltransferase [Steroidobacter sp.]